MIDKGLTGAPAQRRSPPREHGRNKSPADHFELKADIPKLPIARLDFILYSGFKGKLGESGELIWAAQPKTIEKLPQIFWGDGSGWAEANVWALDRAAVGEALNDTVKRNLKHLLTYARFLERAEEDWRHFPVRKEDQPIRMFRKFLIDERDAGSIKPSTATNCMAAVIQFYRFVHLKGLLDSSKPLWVDRQVVVRLHDSAGFKRTISRLSSELSIPNKSAIGQILEDGLLPISADHMAKLLRHTANNESVDFHYMLSIGFFTGARIGSIVTFPTASLHSAREDPLTPGLYRIAAGPGTGIATKFSVSGDILMPAALLEDLKAYAKSTHRLLREAKADKRHKHLLFLTRTGKPYSVATVNTANFQCRHRATASGLHFLQDFTFHQSRATFGTWFMQLMLDSGSKTNAIRVVRDAMLHRDEKTTLGYITFLENSQSKIHAANEFNAAFTGMRERDWSKLNA